MKKTITVIVLGATGFFVIFIGGIFNNNKETSSLSSLANLSSQSAMVSEEENSPIPNKALAGEINQELEKDKQESSAAALAFWQALKTEPAENIVREYIDEKKVTSFGDYQTEEIKFINKIQEVKSTIGEYKDIRLEEASFLGDSWVVVKVCDNEGFCQAFQFSIDQEKNDGSWGIYEMWRQEIKDFDIKENSSKTSEITSGIVIDFLMLTKEKRYAEITGLFHSNTVKGKYKIDKYIQEIENIPFNIDKIEVISRDDIKKISWTALAARNDGIIERHGFSLVKRDNGWKIGEFNREVESGGRQMIKDLF